MLGGLTATGVVAQNPCRILANTGQPGWQLVSGPGVTTPKAPVNVTPHAGWSVLPNSQWISVDASRGSRAGDYVYEYQFTRCPCGQSEALSLSFFADNGATVSLNGGVIDKSSGNENFKGTPRKVNYTGPFAAGANKLRIVVHNEDLATGLDATLDITGATTGVCPGCGGNLTAATGQPGWMLTSGPGVTGPKAPVSVSPYAGWSLLPGSSWVSVDAGRGSSAGNYNYEYTFCKCGAGPMSLQFYADNGATLSLNGGANIFASTGNKNFTGTAAPVNYNGVFAPGDNKLRITVFNSSSVTGLDAVLKVAGATAGPCAKGKTDVASRLDPPVL